MYTSFQLFWVVLFLVGSDNLQSINNYFNFVQAFQFILDMGNNIRTINSATATMYKFVY